MTHPHPVFRYEAGDKSIQVLHPSARRISYDGRTGLHFTSIRGRAALPKHCLNEASGTVSLWVLPLQDFYPAAHHPAHSLSNRFFDRFVFLSDCEAVQETEGANFKLLYCSDWHPVFMIEFERTTAGSLFGRASAGATAGHFEMHAMRWYQIVAAWDHSTGIYVLYANGIKVGHSDATKTVMPRPDKAAPRLYFGNPAYAMGEISFFNQPLTEGQASRLFEESAVVKDPRIQNSLKKTYQGIGLPNLAWHPPTNSDWTKQQSLSLCREEDYAHFYHQGCGPSIRFTEDGFRITTPDFQEYANRKGPKGVFEPFDMTRMYLWTRRMFEGDLYVSLEFKLHAHGGLALLMTQAAGMQGEDFLADYPLRSDGSMSVVCWEDVRNYHWEFYRETVDVRNDLASHACLKNPWFRPLAFQVENRVWELDRWYKLHFLQEGNRLRGIIDNTVVIDVTDSGFDNNGPVLRHGHVALRCMMRTDMTFRNFEVWNQSPFQTTPA